MTTHYRNGGGLSSFVDKCTLASELKSVGDSSSQRQFIQRGRKQKDGKFDPATLRNIKLSLLMTKLGCRRLAHTYAVEKGGMSSRQARRHVNKGTVPNFKVRLSNSLDLQGLKVIDQNITDVFASGIYDDLIDDVDKRCVHLLVDGVATEERLDLDVSQIPNQITGLCGHCTETNFVRIDDIERVERDLDRDGTDTTKIHFAKEVDVYAFAINDRHQTSIVPVALIPTCKKDYEVGESTNTVTTVARVICDRYHQLGMHNKLGPLTTANSDGAAQFRKGMGKLLDNLIPEDIRAVYVECLLFNVAGGPLGMTISCDLDHLGKRFRARIKTAVGISIGVVNFTKTDLAMILAYAGIVTDVNVAEKLFNPEDLMDVSELVQCLDAIGKLAMVPFVQFPSDWRAERGNRTIYEEVKLLGAVVRSMCTMIIGHEGAASEEGVHLSVSEYLTVCSRLSHLLFFLFRRNKTRFCAAQNYRNWQDTVKNMFVTVSVAKKNGVKNFYFFLNTNKALEQLFGILRSMRQGTMNFDCLDLRDRIGDAGLIQWIYSEHPEWDESSRRLTNSMDRKNTRSWKGCTLLADVDVAKCWKQGRDDALAILKESGVFSDAEMDISTIVRDEPGVDMLRPYREQIGVLAGDEVAGVGVETMVVVDLSVVDDDEGDE